ncbi:MAG: hypothetical protein L0154_13950 [Chloroflexi bacterium]|nr:hypothetical protein [Chloroflexota bacterium]
MDQLGFTEADLRANRQGKLSTRQQAFIQRSLDYRSWWPYTGLMMLFFAGLAGYILFFEDDSGYIRSSSLILITMSSLIILPLIIHIGAALWARWRLGRLEHWRVKVIEGRVRLSESEHDVMLVPLKSYRLKIGRLTFHLNGTQLSAFEDGATYRIYYVWMRTILSAGFISAD